MKDFASVPQTEPTRCRDGGTGDQTPHRGCPWTPPRWSQPWPNIQYASQASPETTFKGTETINNSPGINLHLSSHSGTPVGYRSHSESRPTFPHGESHEGSPGLDAFHKAKSLGDFFSLNLSAEMLRSPTHTQKNMYAFMLKPLCERFNNF